MDSAYFVTWRDDGDLGARVCGSFAGAGHGGVFGDCFADVQSGRRVAGFAFLVDVVEFAFGLGVAIEGSCGFLPDGGDGLERESDGSCGTVV